MPSSGESGDAWSAPDVYLVTESREGRVAIPHLRLVVRATGVEVARADGHLAWQCAWSRLDELSSAERSVLPDGRPGLVVVVSERGGFRHRFVVPTDEPRELEDQVRALAAEFGVRTAPPPRADRRWLTAGVVLATAAALAVLLLSAVHVLHL